MPEKNGKRNYNNSKIYKITNDINNDIYVNGTTANYLSDTMHSHRKASEKQNKLINLYQSMRKLGTEHFEIELLENVKCLNKDELNAKKQKWINKLKPSLNFYGCNIENCNYKTKKNTNLKLHLSNIHDIGVKWFNCSEEGCNFKTKQNSTLKKHLSNIHDIGVKWFHCSEEGCDFKTKLNSSLKTHLSNIHDIGVKWFHCSEEGCNYKTTQNSSLKPHLAFVHDIGVKWFHCSEEGCNYKAKTNSSLKTHLAFVHDIGVKWFHCSEEGWNYKAKTNSSLKTHLTNIHNIGVKWFHCSEEGCNSKFKTNSNLNRHLSGVHDIGDNQCNFCLGNVFKLNRYEDIQGEHEICRKCYRKITGKDSRIEHIMSDFLDKYFGIEYLLGSDKSLKSMGGCSLKRPDKLYASPEKVVHIECDERQHPGTSSYTCDEKRISDMFDEFDGQNYTIIRWNPDGYKVPTNKTKIKKREDKLICLLKLMNKVLTIKQESPIMIYFMFYSPDSKSLTKNIPYKLIYDEQDIIDLGR
jgi:hypothetical protein